MNATYELHTIAVLIVAGDMGTVSDQDVATLCIREAVEYMHIRGLLVNECLLNLLSSS